MLVLSYFLYFDELYGPLCCFLCTVSMFWCRVYVLPHVACISEGGVGPCVPLSCLRVEQRKKYCLAMANYSIGARWSDEVIRYAFVVLLLRCGRICLKKKAYYNMFLP